MTLPKAKAQSKAAAKIAAESIIGATKSALKSGAGKVKHADINCGSQRLRHAELIRQLKYFTEPDFTTGADFWPRLDRRLYDQIPLIVQQAIDALDAAYLGKKA